MEKAIDKFANIGFVQKSTPTLDESRGIWICFMEKDGYLIELIESASTASIVHNLYKKIGNGPYHLCYESYDFETDCNDLRSQGAIQLGNKEAAVALNNKEVIFFMMQNIGMIELIDMSKE